MKGVTQKLKSGGLKLSLTQLIISTKSADNLLYQTKKKRVDKKLIVSSKGADNLPYLPKVLTTYHINQEFPQWLKDKNLSFIYILPLSSVINYSHKNIHI